MFCIENILKLWNIKYICKILVIIQKNNLNLYQI